MPLDKGKAKSVQRPGDIFFRRRDLPIQPPAPVPSSSAGFLTSDPFVPLPQSSSFIPAPSLVSRTSTTKPTTTLPTAPRILAVEISPSALRPLAFRIFTKKHNLTLKSDALNLLCTFIGRRCGSDWRDSGSGEKLLDEIARTWKRNAGPGGILVDGGETLKAVLKGLDVPGGSGGQGVGARLLGRERSLDVGTGVASVDDGGDTQMEDGDMSTQELASAASGGGVDPRKYLKVVGAFQQPKWVYNPLKKHFERAPKPSLLPPPTSKTFYFKHRYHILHQRLLRNESFLPPTFTASTKRTSTSTSSSTSAHYTITPISHLLGQHGTSFLLFGMLTISPSGLLSLTDPTGSIPLDITYATPVPLEGAYFSPGCFVVIDGQYSEDPMKFLVLTIGMPPCERREVSAEVWGHVDFLGTGVTLDVNSAQNRALRRVESALPQKMIFMAEVELDVDQTFDALRAVFRVYEDGEETPPLACILMGNFIRVPFGGSIIGRVDNNHAGGAGGAPSTSAVQGSITYKEYWDKLALLLSEFPKLIKSTIFTFVPGDNDPFTATFSGGRSATLPRESVPEVFVNRVKRVLASAQSGGGGGEPDTRGGVWTSNPARISYFASDIVVFRDDASARFSRNAVRFTKSQPQQPPPPESESMDIDPPSTSPPQPAQLPQTTIPPPLLQARKLVKTLLDQAHLSPYPLSTRPVLWDFASHTLSLYPLPKIVVFADVSVEGFAVTYEGCHVVNPGRLVAEGGWGSGSAGGGAGDGSGGGGSRGKKAVWVEVDLMEGRGRGRDAVI